MYTELRIADCCIEPAPCGPISPLDTVIVCDVGWTAAVSCLNRFKVLGLNEHSNARDVGRFGEQGSARDVGRGGEHSSARDVGSSVSTVAHVMSVGTVNPVAHVTSVGAMNTVAHLMSIVR